MINPDPTKGAAGDSSISPPSTTKELTAPAASTPQENAPVASSATPSTAVAPVDAVGDGTNEWTPANVAVLSTYFGATPGVSPGAVEAASAWWSQTYGPNAAPLQPEPAKHPYDFRHVSLSDENMPYLHSFGNAMAARGATESEVYGLLRKFMNELHPEAERQASANARDLAHVTREVQTQDRKDRDTTREVMRGEWGVEHYSRNVRAINAYLDSLPPAELAAIERETTADGRLALNDPAKLRELLQRARGAGATGEAARTAATTPAGTHDVASMTIAEIDHLRRTDRRRFDRTPGIRERHLDLLRAQERGA